MKDVKVLIIGSDNTRKVILSSAIARFGGSLLYASVDAASVTEADVIDFIGSVTDIFDYPISTDSLGAFYTHCADSTLNKFNQLPENQTYVPKVNRKTKRW